jgi:hypothetical protein
VGWPSGYDRYPTRCDAPQLIFKLASMYGSENEQELMEYRYPNWLAYLFLVLLLGFSGVFICVFAMLAPGASQPFGKILFGAFCGACLIALAIAYLYFDRYRVWIGDGVVTVKGPFRAKTIPIPSVAQIITVSTPRGGTGSFLLDNGNRVLAKLDDSLEGPGSAVVVLEQEARPYQVKVFRRGVLGPWERRNAGDLHWSPSDAPKFVRDNDRAVIYIVVVALLFVVSVAAIQVWVSHGGLDKLP